VASNPLFTLRCLVKSVDLTPNAFFAVITPIERRAINRQHLTPMLQTSAMHDRNLKPSMGMFFLYFPKIFARAIVMLPISHVFLMNAFQ
jgi:hypothetical protein